MSKTSEQEAGSDLSLGRTDDTITPWREFVHAFQVQASMPRTWPALLFIVSAAVLTTILALVTVIWAVAAVSTPGWPSAPPPWLIATGVPSAVYLLMLLTRLDSGRQRVEAWFREHGTLLKPGLGVVEDWLLREVIDQCRSFGISRAPDVYIYDPEVFDWGPFAHAGLADEGRVGIPEPWLRETTDDVLRFAVGHELSHILHRDGFVRGVVDVFVVFFLSFLGYLCALSALAVLGVTILFALLLVGAIAIVAASLGSADMLLAALSEVPDVLLTSARRSQAEWVVTVAVGVTLVGGCMILYRLWVERRQELKADEMAFRIAGAEVAQQGIDRIAQIEGAVGEGPFPVTRERCRGTVAGALTSIVPRRMPQCGDTRGARWALSLAEWIGERIGDGLWMGVHVLLCIPGAKAVRHTVWRLTRTHPPPAERKRHIERLLAAHPEPSSETGCS